ncbi:MAG: beta-propeller domain-containing protein, partial [Alistipes sp.]|nr:beta-propeller domain-containing protein [Alistipes sp.]
MAMEEKKIIEKLQEMTEDTKVPESLAPENIMNTIKGKKSNRGGSLPRKTVRVAATLVSAAAVLLAVTFVTRQIGGGITKENILSGNSVSANSEKSGETQADEALTESQVMAQTGNISGYDEVYAELKTYRDRYQRRNPTFWEYIFGSKSDSGGMAVTEDMIMNEAATVAQSVNGAEAEGKFSFDDAAPAESAVTTGSAEGSYSKTNVQTVGIDEADIIKTDGKYIYYASTDLHTISVYRVDKGESEKVSDIYVEGVGSLEEIYVDGDMLLCEGTSYRNDTYNVALAKYDISDRKKPEYISIYTQEGSSVETRKIGNVVYIITTVYSDVTQMKKSEPETYIPRICDDLVPPENIFIPENTQNTAYTVISSVDVADMRAVDSAAVLGFDGTFYMGTENMYLYRTSWETTDNMTDIRKIDYISDGNIGAVTEGKIPGVIKDTFAINEYNGYLRVMTTSYAAVNNRESTNNVFVLDSSLKVVGSVEGLAQGERIYSARYMGDVAYFVTYRETDPLFSVDLSDPKNPRIMGALKIPGFSEYMHPWGKGKLLGIGLENNDRGWGQYVKLSMFDTSDPYNVVEEDKILLYDANYAEALYDYKAVMIDADKNLFGFMTEDYEASGRCRYQVFTYTDKGFREIFSVTFSDFPWETRAVYI